MSESLSIAAQIQQIEAARHSAVVVLAASNLEMELLPPLYDTLRAIGRVERLDVVLYCRGGVVNAARRIALLLNEFTADLGLVVPHYCESAGTVMTLAARGIIAGPLAIFSPIDPLLQSDTASAGAPAAASCQDIRLFGNMCKEWFGLEPRDASERSLSALCESIFPTTLTSFYRTTLELREIGVELLSLHMQDSEPDLRSRIVERLLFGYHSHSYAITREEMRNIGLPIARDSAVEDLAWRIACELHGLVGSGLRQTPGEDWFDTAIVTRDRATVRRRGRDRLTPVWEPCRIR